MKNKTMMALCVALALGISGCEPAAETTASAAGNQGNVAASSALKSGIYLSNLDTQIKPQDDFFRYVNGNWLAKTEIPADKSRWGSFDELRDSSSKHVLQIVKDAAAKPAEAGSDPQKIGDMYRAFMDTATIEKLGLSPLAADVARIDQLKSPADLATLWGQLQVERYGTPVGVLVGQDQKNSTQYITGMNQSGLGLPDRDYYLKSDEKAEKIKKQYQWMIAKYWELAGWPEGSLAAEKIFAIETKLANAQWSRVQNRDRTKTYNKMTIAELSTRASGFDWQAFLTAAELGAVNEVVVPQPDYLTPISKN